MVMAATHVLAQQAQHDNIKQVSDDCIGNIRYHLGKTVEAALRQISPGEAWGVRDRAYGVQKGNKKIPTTVGISCPIPVASAAPAIPSRSGP